MFPNKTLPLRLFLMKLPFPNEYGQIYVFMSYFLVYWDKRLPPGRARSNQSQTNGKSHHAHVIKMWVDKVLKIKVEWNFPLDLLIN